MASVLVTGASGRLGRPLAAALAAAGHRVVGCGFRSADLPRADLRDPEQVRAVVSAHPRLEAVVHLAALAHAGDRPDRRSLYAVNVQGTHTLLAETARAGIEHFVLASSIDVYSPQSLLAGPIAETTPLAPSTDYGRTKAEAETTVGEWADRFGRVSVLRLAPLYGENLLTDLRKRVVLVGGVGYRWQPARPRLSLCHLENAVEAMMRVVERQGPRRGVFNVRDTSYASQDDLRRYLVAAGRAPWISLPVPALFVRPLLALAAAARSPLSGALRSRLVKAFGQSLVEIEPLRALGYQGTVGLGARSTPRPS